MNYDETMIRRMTTVNQVVAFILSRPEMFIGRRWDSDGLYYLIFLIMESALEPEKANQCSSLEVVIESETWLSISDNGRGLPVESARIDQSVRLPKIEHVFSWMFTTNPLPTYYEKFGFLNYLGFIFNAMSRRLLIETCFEGQAYRLTCGQGEIVQRLKQAADPHIQKGTRFTFTPDQAIFPCFKFDFASLETRLRELKSAFPAVSITLEDKTSNQKKEI
jgi:DNA gyrase subunit B